LSKAKRSGAIDTLYYVYILKLNNNNLYVGFSENLQERIKSHDYGLVKATKSFKPFKLVFYCAFLSKKKALDFEKYLKSSSGFAFRKKRLI
jgi:putative endonuclease